MTYNLYLKPIDDVATYLKRQFLPQAVSIGNKVGIFRIDLSDDFPEVHCPHYRHLCKICVFNTIPSLLR